MRRKRKTNNYTPKPKVYLPQNKNSTQRKKAVKKSKASKTRKPTRRKKGLNIKQVLFYILGPVLLVLLLYLSVIFILRTRSRVDMEVYEQNDIIGIQDIPQYPYSEFIFSEMMGEQSVVNFINSGNTAYRITGNKTFKDVSVFYNEKLPERGWTNVLSVETGSREMKSGEYWVKDNTGLRIYSKFNDIWYEIISTDDAISGLRARVTAEAERDLLLAGQELQDLLPDFPWVVKVPKEYVITYRTSDLETARSVYFRKIGTEESVSVIPVGKSGTSNNDTLLGNYVDYLNSLDDGSWVVGNTFLSFTRWGQALSGTLKDSGGDIRDVLVVGNPYDKLVYIIDSTSQGNEFYNYIIENMEPQGFSTD